MDLIEEPQSGALLPAVVQTDHCISPLPLLGSAVRFKAVFGVDVQVYAFSVYGAPEILSKVQPPIEAEELLSVLLNSEEEKVFCLTFLRAVPGRRAADAVKECLIEIGGVPAEQAAALQEHFPPSITKGMELKFVARPRHDEVILQGAWVENGRRTFHGRELCRGLHEIYLGEKAVVRGLGKSLRSQYANLQVSHLPHSISSSDSELSSPDAHPASRKQHCGSLVTIASSGQLTDTAPDGQPEREGQSFSFESPSRNPQEASWGTPPTMLESPLVQITSDSPTLMRSKSWKTSSGRENGGDGYKFGDMTRMLVQKVRRKRVDTGSSVGSFGHVEEHAPYALVNEEASSWISPDSVLQLDAGGVETISLDGALYKHHASLVRGRFVPRWTLRYYQLRAGVLKYRKFAGGRIRGELKLDGAYVVVEPPKTCHFGDCYTFRVISRLGETYKLSCPDLQKATHWVIAMSSVCAFFGARLGAPRMLAADNRDVPTLADATTCDDLRDTAVNAADNDVAGNTTTAESCAAVDEHETAAAAHAVVCSQNPIGENIAATGSETRISRQDDTFKQMRGQVVKVYAGLEATMSRLAVVFEQVLPRHVKIAPAWWKRALPLLAALLVVLLRRRYRGRQILSKSRQLCA